jgi:regulator of protease activity HflC (stomatin/prohibitin superfamily)
MKKQLLTIIAAVFTLSTVTSCNRIDAGHVGIKVNLYGSNKGISDVTEVTGMVWYNPFTKSVYEVPTFVQNAVYTHDEIDESDKNEEFRVTTKDGMIAAFDLSMNYLTPAENVTSIFKKYRKPVKELEKTVVRTYLREAFNNIASKYTAEGLYENRADFEKQAEVKAVEILSKEGFVVEQIVILNEIRLPADITKRINDKVKAAQITKQKKEEVAQQIADSEKRIAKAKGDSTAMVVMAAAQAMAYKVKKQELNDLLIQQQFIEKWNGNYGSGNVFNGSPLIYKNIK